MYALQRGVDGERSLGGRLTKQSGLLGSVRLHPLARLGAVLALFSYILVGLSPVWVPSVERGGIEICTADGIRIVPADLPSADGPSGQQKPKADCLLCTIQTAFLLPPASASLELFAHNRTVLVEPEPAGETAGRFAGFHHFSRAPPLPS